MAEGHTPERFVPSGVDAQTWIGFEARIQERRFKALLVTINTAIAARDGMAARVALEELRELRPMAADLPDLAARVALLPVGAEAAASSYLWSRGLGAVATFVVGIGLVVGLETIRPGVNAPAAVSPAPVSQVISAAAQPAETTAAPALTATDTASDATAVPLDTASVVVDSKGEEPVGTAGARASSSDDRGIVTPNRTTFREAVDIEAVVPAGGEIPDDYVAADPRSENRQGYTEAAPAAGAAIAANVIRQPVSITQPPPVVPEANATIGTSTAPARTDPALALRANNERVAQVLNRYVRAYGNLDPRAARAVWPSVDERALSRAFASLESQDVSFDNCDIDVKGDTASASCRGRASYVGKVGNKQPRTEAREWNFELTRQGDDWKIAKADVR
jgi:hypothetical protein